MRGVVKFLYRLIIGLALIWAGFWWYAQARLQSGFQAWAAQQSANGWKIAYDSLQRGTSPLNARLTIDHLVLMPPPGPNGESLAISLPSVVLRIAATDPLVYHTDLPNQITFAFGNDIGFAVNASAIGAAENLDPHSLFNRHAYPFRSGDFTASNVQILASSLLVLQIDRIRSHADIDMQAQGNGTALATTTTLDGLALSPLLTRIAAVPFGGKLAHLALNLAVSGPVPANLNQLADQLDAVTHARAKEQKLLAPVLHQWASGGGHARLALNIVAGPSTLNAAAALGFDANLQPRGSADLAADRLGEFTAALASAYPSIADDIAQAQARLSPYIGDSPQGGQTLGMHIVYGAGAVSINGQKVSDLPPLDWNALENPPPAIAAPGDGSGAGSQMNSE